MTFEIAFVTVHYDPGRNAGIPACGETADVDLSAVVGEVTCRKCMRTIAYKLQVLKRPCENKAKGQT